MPWLWLGLPFVLNLIGQDYSSWPGHLVGISNIGINVVRNRKAISLKCFYFFVLKDFYQYLPCFYSFQHPYRDDYWKGENKHHMIHWLEITVQWIRTNSKVKENVRKSKISRAYTTYFPHSEKHNLMLFSLLGEVQIPWSALRRKMLLRLVSASRSSFAIYLSLH